jgi:6-phosphogluconolactonase (cycloisomerase 2 family)
VVNTGANTISVYLIDQITGALTPTAGAGTASNPVSITIAQIGANVYAYVPNFRANLISVYSVDQATGVLTGLASAFTGTNPYAVAVDPLGKFAYAANYNSNTISVFTIGADGALTPGLTPTAAAGTNPYSITIRQIPSTVNFAAYVLNAGSNTISVYTINPTTGALENPATVAF